MSLKVPIVETDRVKVQENIRKGSTILYEVARAAYGPSSSNVMLGFSHGAPLFSHDGVTNLEMVRDSDPFVDDAIQSIKTISRQNNQKVGDGTTAVVILAHHLLMAAQRMEGLGVPQKEIVNKLSQTREKALAYIDSISKPVKDGASSLEKVATISANDPEIGAMIADVMKEVGTDGGVVIESYEGLGVHPEVVNGFYFGQGFKDVRLINDRGNAQSLHSNVPILISSKKLATNVDGAPILESIRVKGHKELILIAEVGDEFLETIVRAASNGNMFVCVVEPPFVSGSRTLFLDDIALLTGAKIYEGVEFEDPDDLLGNAEEVLVNAGSTTVLGGLGKEKDIKKRVNMLREQVKESTHPQDIQFAKDRLARLAGKMAKIRVGGALELERDELKLRIQDSVSAVQSAVKEGIVPGGGTTLAQVTGTAFDDALKEPFNTLMNNAGFNPQAYLPKLSEWKGFDLTKLKDEPDDMLKLGVVDATLVIKEVVRNSVSVVSALIMSGAALSFEEKD